MAFRGSGYSTPSSFGLPGATGLPRRLWNRIRGKKRDVSSQEPPSFDQQSLDSSNVVDKQAEDQLKHDDDVSEASSLWSRAYHEAVLSASEDVDIAILTGQNVEWLFTQLQDVEKGSCEGSLLRKGVAYLKKLKVPLETFKLALDLTTPIANMEPIAGTVLGMVRGATAIAISISTADEELAKQIGEMLERIAYIDDCDTLGQKSETNHIHTALVKVYRNLLEFYCVALDMLTKKGTRLLLKLVVPDGRLPDIVKEFLNHASQLKDIVHNETLAIVQDIKTMLYDEQINRWLGGGNKMLRRNQIHNDLQLLRADEACEWLLQDDCFLEWYQAPTSQHLAILGNLGSGKTVSMSYLIDVVISRSKYRIPQPKICYHYCRNDESGSATSAYSTLILALLEQFSGLKKSFYEWYKQILASGSPGPATHPGKLEEFLITYVEGLERQLLIVVDGLDECDEASRKRIIKLTRGLASHTSKLKILLSSRPEEDIIRELGDMPAIRIQPNPCRDAIIVQRTVENQLPNLSADAKDLIIQELSHRSEGSAIWIRKAVELISIKNVKAPLFSKYTKDDHENQQLATRALEILAVARVPLSITEFAWAVAISEAPEDLHSVADLGSDFVDSARILHFVHPFISAVDFDEPRRRQVTLVHQSVKELVMSVSPLDWANIDGPVHARPSKKRVEALEAQNLAMCLRYLLLDEIGQHDLFSAEQVCFIEMPQGDDLFSDNSETQEYDPISTWEKLEEEDMLRYDTYGNILGELFSYASVHWVEYYSKVAVGHLPELWQIEKICQKGSKRLENWAKQNCRPERTIQAQWDFDSGLFDPLVTTALYGSEAMLRSLLENSEFAVDIYLDDTFQRAADQLLVWWQSGDVSRIPLLFFARQSGSQLRNSYFFGEIVSGWAKRPKDDSGWDAVFDLVFEVVGEMVEQQWANKLLCVAAERNCLPVVQRLLDAARRNNDLSHQLQFGVRLLNTSFGRPLNQSIGEAVYQNHVEMVKYLMAQDGLKAHLKYRNAHGENVLHIASRFCNPTMFRILVAEFKEGVMEVDNDNNTVLGSVIAASNLSRDDRCESARILLLEGGADANDKRQDLLRMAIRRGHLDMCRVLIVDGKADPLSAVDIGEHGEVILKDENVVSEDNTAALLQLLFPDGRGTRVQ